MRPSVTQEELLRLFNYKEGNFYYKVATSPRVKVGQIAGTIKPDGYVRVKIDGKLYYLHRLVWLYHKGVWPKGEIDHIDRNPSNNNIYNLRDVDRSTNMVNTARRKNKTSRYRGVCWNKRLNKWVSACTRNYKSKHIGVFDTEEDAHTAYKNYLGDLV